jgi:hypothetical protein
MVTGNWIAGASDEAEGAEAGGMDASLPAKEFAGVRLGVAGLEELWPTAEAAIANPRIAEPRRDCRTNIRTDFPLKKSGYFHHARKSAWSQSPKSGMQLKSN